MSARGSVLVSLVLAASLLAAVRGAHAEEPFTCPVTPTDEADRIALARRVFEDGDHREASDPEAALARYRCAELIAVRPVIELRIGIVAERLDQVDAAIAAYEQYLHLAGGDPPDRPDVERRIQRLRARSQPSPPPPPSSPSSPPSPPPSPVSSSSSPSSSSAPPAERPTTGRRWLSVALIGVGAALAAAGVVLLIDARLKSDEALGVPTGTPWKSAAASGTYDAAKTEQTLGIVGLSLGGAAVGAGVVVLVTGGASRVPGGSPSPAGAVGVVTWRF